MLDGTQERDETRASADLQRNFDERTKTAVTSPTPHISSSFLSNIVGFKDLPTTPCPLLSQVNSQRSKTWYIYPHLLPWSARYCHIFGAAGEVIEAYYIKERVEDRCISAASMDLSDFEIMYLLGWQEEVIYFPLFPPLA